MCFGIDFVYNLPNRGMTLCHMQAGLKGQNLIDNSCAYTETLAGSLYIYLKPQLYWGGLFLVH